MIKIYRKTATIKAEQFDGSNRMLYDYHIIAVRRYGSEHNYCVTNESVPVFKDEYFLPTLEGKRKVDVGDWIATSINGVHWVIDDDMFKVIYKEKAVVPEYVESFIEESWGLGASVYETLGGAIDLAEASNPDEQKLGRWVKDNEKLFVRALLDYYYSKDGE